MLDITVPTWLSSAVGQRKLTMNASWTDVTQAFCAIGTFVIALVGLPFLIYQIRQLERAVQGDTQEKMFSKSFEIIQRMLEHPEVRPYILGGQRVPEKSEVQPTVRAFVEMLADFFELIYLQRTNMEDDIWVSWSSYIHDIYKRCPELQVYFDENATWYFSPFLAFLKENGVQQTGGADVLPGEASLRSKPVND